MDAVLAEDRATSTSSAWRLMVFKTLIRYTGLAVGLKPSA